MQVGLHTHTRSAWRPFTIAPPTRRSLTASRVVRVKNSQQEPSHTDASEAVLAGFLAFSAAVGLPQQVEAGQMQNVSDFNNLQQAAVDRAAAGSPLLSSFAKNSTLAAVGAQKLPEAPKVKGNTQSEPASKPPSGAGPSPQSGSKDLKTPTTSERGIAGKSRPPLGAIGVQQLPKDPPKVSGSNINATKSSPAIGANPPPKNTPTDSERGIAGKSRPPLAAIGAQQLPKDPPKVSGSTVNATKSSPAIGANPPPKNTPTDSERGIAGKSRPPLAAIGAQKLPEPPKVQGSTQKEPASKPPPGTGSDPPPKNAQSSGQGGIGGLFKPTLSAAGLLNSNASSGGPQSQLAGLGAAIVALGFAGVTFLAGDSSSGQKATKTAQKLSSKAQGGTKKIGGANKQSPAKAASGLFGGAKQQAKQPAKAAKGLFGSAKQQAKQPAKAAGGLFGGAKQQAKQPAKAAGGLLGDAKRQAKKTAGGASGLFGGAKQQAKQPAKAASGLFGAAKQQAKQPIKAAKRAAPSATKKIGKPGTQKVGSARAGTKKIGGSARGKGAGSSARIGPFQLDDDTVTTLAAISVVGLGLLVSGFVVLNVVTGVEVPGVPEALEPREIAKNLPELPSAGKPAEIAGDVKKAAQNTAAKAEQAIGAPPQTAQKAEEGAQKTSPAAAAPVEKAKEILPQVSQAAQKATDAVPSPGQNPAGDIAQKAADSVPSPPSNVQNAAGDFAQKASDAAPSLPSIGKNPAGEVAQKAADAAPSLPSSPQSAVNNVAQNVADAAPSPPADVQKATSQAAQKASDALPSPPPELQKAPKGVSQTTGDALPQISDKAPSAAFEQARKQLGSGPSAAEQFKAALSEPTEKTKSGATAGSKAPIPSISSIKGSTSKIAPKGSTGGVNNNALVLGGLVIVIGGVAAAVSGGGGDGGGGGGGPGPGATTSSAPNSSGGGEAESSGPADVKDDIDQRKSEARGWIQDWRQRTGEK